MAWGPRMNKMGKRRKAAEDQHLTPLYFLTSDVWAALHSPATTAKAAMLCLPWWAVPSNCEPKEPFLKLILSLIHCPQQLGTKRLLLPLTQHLWSIRLWSWCFTSIDASFGLTGRMKTGSKVSLHYRWACQSLWKCLSNLSHSLSRLKAQRQVNILNLRSFSIPGGSKLWRMPLTLPCRAIILLKARLHLGIEVITCRN